MYQAVKFPRLKLLFAGHVYGQPRSQGLSLFLAPGGGGGGGRGETLGTRLVYGLIHQISCVSKDLQTNQA